MKKIFTRTIVTLTALAFFSTSFAAPTAAVVLPLENKPLNTVKPESKDQSLTSEIVKKGLDQFMNLTPAKYKELTGKKLGFKKSVELKIAQKLLKGKKADEPQISKGLYVVLAIIGFGWLAMGILDNWKGDDWIIALVLSLVFWLPGVIYSLIKMKKYYP